MKARIGFIKASALRLPDISTDMIIYQTTTKGISAKNLNDFFVGWPKKPSSKMHLKLLKNSDHIILAIDAKNQQVIGFITAITDKTLSAYIPFLEVLPEYQSKGIGTKLIKKMLSLLKDFYMIDLLCDSNLQPFYEKLGMKKATGMMQRNYKHQSGK